MKEYYVQFHRADGTWSNILKFESVQEAKDYIASLWSMVASAFRVVDANGKVVE